MSLGRFCTAAPGWRSSLSPLLLLSFTTELGKTTLTCCNSQPFGRMRRVHASKLRRRRSVEGRADLRGHRSHLSACLTLGQFRRTTDHSFTFSGSIFSRAKHYAVFVGDDVCLPVFKVSLQRNAAQCLQTGGRLSSVCHLKNLIYHLLANCNSSLSPQLKTYPAPPIPPIPVHLFDWHSRGVKLC